MIWMVKKHICFNKHYKEQRFVVKRKFSKRLKIMNLFFNFSNYVKYIYYLYKCQSPLCAKNIPVGKLGGSLVIRVLKLVKTKNKLNLLSISLSKGNWF